MPAPDAAALICGALLIGWIGVELGGVREVTVLRPVGVLVGAVLIGSACAARVSRPGAVTGPARG